MLISKINKKQIINKTKTMKTIFKTVLFSLFLCNFYSCNSDDDEQTQQAENYFLTVKIDGNSRSFNEIVSVSATADQVNFIK